MKFRLRPFFAFSAKISYIYCRTLNNFEIKKDMRTLNVSISDIEYNKFGLKEDKLTFTDFIDLVTKELTRQNLNKCLELADKYGLSKMTMDEITYEVKAVRKNAKNRN